MNTHTLIIQNDLKIPVVQIQIGDLDPAEATVAILAALANLKPKRKKRKDAGSSRKGA